MKPPMRKATPPTRKREAPRKNPAAMPAPGSNHEMMRMRAQDALHTIERAHEHMADPALMGHVQRLAADKRDILKKIARKRG